MIIRRSIYILIVLLWMALIFYFSHQTGGVSSGFSDKIANSMIDIFIPNFDTLPSLEQIDIKAGFSFAVRKMAHYTEYFVLGCLLSLAIASFTRRELYIYTIASIIGILYAIGDEFHQSFIGGRNPAVKDVLIDSIGLVTAVLIVGIISNFIKIKKQTRVIKYD